MKLLYFIFIQAEYNGVDNYQDFSHSVSKTNHQVFSLDTKTIKTFLISTV